MSRKLLYICISILFGTILIHASERRSKYKAEQIIGDICERLYDDDLYFDENRKWYRLCQEWIEKKERKRDEILQDETIMDEPYMTHIVQPRRGGGGGGRGGGRGGRGGFRGAGRFSSGGARASRIGGSSRTGRGARSSSSSIARFRNIRTVTIIPRAVQMVARVFYTLAAVTLCIHVFMRHFY